MLRIFHWIKLMHKFRGIILKNNFLYSFHYIKYNKLLEDKNYKLLKKKYNFFTKFFLSKLPSEIIGCLFDKNKNDNDKINFINNFFDRNLYKLSYFQLIFIYNYFRFFDSLFIAQFFFAKLNLYLLEKYKKNKFKSNELRLILNAAIYNKNLDVFNNILRKFNDKDLIFYRIIKLLMEKKYSELNIIIKSVNYDSSDLDYLRFITNKKIFILGPNYEKSQFNYEYDEKKDIFIFTSFKKYTNLIIENSICYINSFKINNFIKQIKDSLHKFNWFVSKSNIDDLKIRELANFKSKIMKNSRIIFNNGSPMMIQCIIYDLIFYLPKFIYLTGIDFYLFSSAGNSEYKNYERDNYSIATSIREHDIFENKKFIEFMTEFELIKVDDKIKDILNINDYYFSKTLDFHYKSHTF